MYGDHFKSDIDSWISFAFQKGVKRLHLIFTCNWALNNRSYILTPPMLCNYRPYLLTELRLCFVKVTGEALEYILFACPFLESLYISMAHVMNCKISSPSLKLKHLEIFSCVLESFYINAENLVSVKYLGAVRKDFIQVHTPAFRKASCLLYHQEYFPASKLYLSAIDTCIGHRYGG